MEKFPFHLVPGSSGRWRGPCMTSMVGGQCVNGDDNGTWEKTHQPPIEGLMHNKTSSSLSCMAKMPRFLKGA